MPKSDEDLSDLSSTSESGSEEEPKSKKKKIEAKPKREEKKLTEDKKSTKSTEEKKSSKSTTEVKKGDNGEFMIELSNNKFITISEFRNKTFVGIREFYEKDGKLLPGKKGIALNLDQWKRLKECISDVDGCVENM